MKKYIFVTGGVSSSLGKGVAAASLGSLLETRGLAVRIIKIDPYINVDAGTMSPYQHGEVYVTDDGAETDLDLGNYARFTSAPLGRENSITTGQVYQEVIKREREGRYLGRTVQVIPHITDEIKRRISVVGEREEVDVTIIEVGGTVGDIESIPFLEAARQFIHDIGKKNVLFIHVTLAPMVGNQELKTKPTQHSVKELREIGIQPDILLCRAARPLSKDERRKIALFTNVEEEGVISAYDVPTTIYEIPLVFHRQRLDDIVVEKLSIECGEADLTRWVGVVDAYTSASRTLKIALVGKYLDLLDSYKSVNEALVHGGIANGVRIEIVKIDSEQIKESEALEQALAGIDGMLIPGGFGSRGIDGMVMAARYARVNNMPCFGICLGLQVMVIEYARSILGLTDANSTEFAPNNAAPVISLLEEQMDVKDYGGTMRLGKCETKLCDGTKIREVYSEALISERHRHRYEVSNRYRPSLVENGLIVSGVTTDDALVESIQWKDHPWGIGVQFHPEFKSKPFAPHPLFASFIKASLAHAR
ncbi:MAG TPA: CTP synthase [Spirochaetia bacterium]|nr:CTP synthase [Spirochaetia bacterium]